MPGLDRETLDMILSSLVTYSERELTPEYLLALDERDEFPQEVLDRLYDPGALGIHLLFLPEEHGGFGAGAYDIYRVAETLAGIDLGISTAVLATFLGTDPIIVGGTEEQKEHWMGRIAAEGLLVAYGATEPQAGSDLSLLQTRAVPVEDNGHGIKPALLGKIFEPFFTTKEKGKGTGLGLSTVYGIVKQSGGFIFADSEVGKGTRFTIYLPVHVPDPAEAVEAAKPKGETRRTQWTGGGRVLLVEDEDTVRAVAERALVRQGYEVTTAADGEDGLEALSRIMAAGSDIDLVVSDVVMPSMDGPAMAREIRRVKPDLPVLFMSGYAEEQLRREIDIPNMHFLAKPFSVAQIVAAVEQVLRGE